MTATKLNNLPPGSLVRLTQPSEYLAPSGSGKVVATVRAGRISVGLARLLVRHNPRALALLRLCDEADPPL